MEKAGDMIKDALGEIVVAGAEAPVEPDEIQLGIRYMNRMMAALDARGVPLGYTEVSSLGDTVTIPAGANEGVIALLALRLWNQFSDGQPPPPVLIATAKSGLKALMDITFSIGQTEYPSTLPIGSGNEGDSTFNTTHFYPDLQADILAETTGSIGLEESTVE